MGLKPNARHIYNDMQNHRFVLLVSGRRYGKTQLIGYDIITTAYFNAGIQIAYVAPTLKMARELMWNFLMSKTDKRLIANKNKTDNTIELINGTIISLWGGKEYDSIRGQGFHYVYLDEAAYIPVEAWTEVLQATITTTMGKVRFISTPNGKSNWFYDMYLSNMCKNYVRTSLDGGWISAEEIERVQSRCDEKTFKQEYLASFETTGNAVYYMFDDYCNTNIEYNPSARTVLCWDFNINPLCTIVVQEFEPDKWAAVHEFVIPNQNTNSQCEMIINWLDETKFNGHLEITGDNTGEGIKTSSVSRSDYDIIRAYFKNVSGFDVNRDIHKKPTRRVKDRINATNGMFRNMAGEQRLYINFDRCQKLVKDLRITEWKANGINIDKKSGVSDASDALSYFPYNYYPIENDKARIVII